MSTIKRWTKVAVLFFAGAMLFGSSVATAHRGGGWHRGKRMKGKRGCAKMLMRAPSWMLKKKLKLNDGQIAQLKTIRGNIVKSVIPTRAKIKLLRFEIRQLMDNPQVDEQKVLALSSKIHALRGQMKTLRIKTKLKIRKLLTAEQKSNLRKLCRRRMMRRFRRFGRHGRFHRFGRRGRFSKYGRHGRFQRYGRRGGHGRFNRRWNRDNQDNNPETKPSTPQKTL